jgi:tRNA-binding EMAP/Myf-like protein
MTISTTAKKIIKAALTETNPNSIAAATSLTVQAVYANLNNLKKNNLANYDSEAKVLTLTEEGIRVANEEDIVAGPGISTAEATDVSQTLNVVVTGKGTNKERAWAIIDAMQAQEGVRRKDIVKELVVQLGITANNAGVYIQNHRKAHGLVTARPTKVVDPTDI